MLLLPKRKRAPAWRYREIANLLAIWGEETIQLDLKTNRQNIDIYDSISQAMRRLGHNWTAKECRHKVKSLKHKYKKAVSHNSMSGNTRHVCQFFAKLYNILGMDVIIVPSRMSRVIDLEVVREGDKREQRDGSELSGMSYQDLQTFDPQDIAVPSTSHGSPGTSYQDLQTVNPRGIAVLSTSHGYNWQKSSQNHWQSSLRVPREQEKSQKTGGG